jgi:hypothetical protein
VNADIANHYEVGKKYWWWSFSSASTDASIATQFMGYAGEEAQVLIQVHFRSHVVDISQFSANAKEKEVLIFPARHLRVANSVTLSPNLSLLELVEEEEAPNMLFGIDIPAWKKMVRITPIFVKNR